MSKINNLANYLNSGATATPRQVRSMFKIANPSAAVHALRSRGMLVYTNKTTLRDGTQTVQYKTGKPTKKMVRVLQDLGFFA